VYIKTGNICSGMTLIHYPCLHGGGVISSELCNDYRRKK
jgi:hypothetical protein